MKVFVLRHGEARPFASTDSARPLSEFGQQQAREQGEWLAQHYPTLQKVLVSPYLRTQQTCQYVLQAYSSPPEVETFNGLTPYGNANTVVDYVATLAGQCQEVLLISHLPLVEEIARALGIQNYIGFHTATLAEIDWDTQRGELVQVRKIKRD